MATNSYFRDCPMCHGNDCLDYCYDSKLGVAGGEVATCLECGWMTWVVEESANLADINDMRLSEGLKPLKKLRPQNP